MVTDSADRVTDQVNQPRPEILPPRPAAMPFLTHPSPRRAAAMIALAWLPALVVAAGLPRYVPVFERWRWELPPLTEALMAVGRLGFWPTVLAGTVLVAVMACAGAGWAQAGLPYRRAVVFALAVAGLGVFVTGMAGTLGPLLTFRIP